MAIDLARLAHRILDSVISLRKNWYFIVLVNHWRHPPHGLTECLLSSAPGEAEARKRSWQG